MDKTKADSILGGISNILDSLGDLAEKGKQLKHAVHAAENSSVDPDTRAQRFAARIITHTEITDFGCKLTLLTGDLTKAKVDLKVQDDILHVEIIREQSIEYEDVTLKTGFHINSVSMHQAVVTIEAHYPQ